MSNLVMVSGDFCSGSTLMSTLFRKSGLFCCLYEPLHERLPQYLLYKVQPLEQDHHFYMDDYYRELRSFPHVGALFDSRWGNSGLFLAPDAEADGLYRYLSYIIGEAFARSPRVMLKENRIAFRLGWLRGKFPSARFVHIYRDKEAQWKSVVRRAQAHVGREDVGQGSPLFAGFNVAASCEDLKATFPELDAQHFKTGFERFSKLWDLSYEHNVRYADISIAYEDLIRDFDATCERLWGVVGVTGVDTEMLRQYVVRPEQRTTLSSSASFGGRVRSTVQRLQRRYGRVRGRLEARRHQ